MPIALMDKIIALICSVTDQQIQELPPAERRRLADQCRHLALRADRTGAARAGVLFDLRTRGGDE